MSKSLLRIVAVVAVAALIFGTVAAALGSLAGADDTHPPQPTPSSSTAIPTEIGDIDATTAAHVLAEFAAKLGVSTAETKAALHAVAAQLAPERTPRSEADLVDLRTAATEALGVELGLSTESVDRAVTRQIVESYSEHQPLIDAHLDKAVAAGHLTPAQVEALKSGAADGSIGTN